MNNTWYLDCEMYARDKMPDPKVDTITCWSLTDGHQTYSAILDDFSIMEKEDSWVIMHTTHEKSFLQLLDWILRNEKIDILTGWNISWDLDYLTERMKLYGMRLSLDGICDFDLLTAYRKLYRRKSYRLRDIVVDEGFESKLEEKVDYGQLWERDKASLLERNRRHAYWVYQVDSKLQIIDYFSELRYLAGLEDLSSAIHNSVIIDTMLLRMTDKALPTRTEKKHEAYEGALVTQPPYKIATNVALYDMSRFFPSIILDNKLDPAILHEFMQTHDKLDWAEYRTFANSYRGKTIILNLVQEMIKEREKLQLAGHVGKLAAVKGILNSTYGVLAFSGFRLYTLEIPARVTELSREIIASLGHDIKNWGIDVLYHDTDSAHVELGNNNPYELENKLNQLLKKYGDYTIKLEAVYEKVAYLGVKKRYICLDNQGNLHITGFDSIKSDTSNYTKEVQETVIKMILTDKGDDIIPYLKGIINNIKRVSLADIVVVKTLSRNPEDYTGVQQGYIKEIKRTGMKVSAGDAVKIVNCKNRPYGVAVFQDIEEVSDIQVDYNAIVEKQIKMKVEDILPLVGLSFEEAVGQAKLL